MPPLSSKQMIRVYLVLLAAVAFLWNRNALPSWMKAEFYGERDAVRVAAGFSFLPPTLGRGVSLKGRPVLVVGDSIVLNWPWDSDRIAVSGADTWTISRWMVNLLGGRQYEQVVLWPGTAHVLGDDTIESYVEGVAAMVAIARQHGEQVYVVGPIPYEHELVVSGEEFGPDAPKGTATVVPAMIAALRERLPDVPVVDPTAFREGVKRADRFDAAFRDGLHLTHAGFLEFGAVLRAAGIRTPSPRGGDATAPPAASQARF